jgi:hypothetical protein
MGISDEALEKFRKAILRRKIEAGGALMNRHPELLVPAIGDRNGPAALDYLSRWIDVDPKFADHVAKFLPTFHDHMNDISFGGCIHVRMAEGFAALHGELYSCGIEHFRFALTLAKTVSATELEGACHFNLGRLLRRTGQLQDALHHADEARVIAKKQGWKSMEAISEILRSRLLSPLGRADEADTALKKAEDLLDQKDPIRATLLIVRARNMRRLGSTSYDKAYSICKEALAMYEKTSPTSPSFAYALTNAAFLIHLTAGDKMAKRERELRPLASKYLERAGQILRSPNAQYGRGRSNIELNYGLICLDEDKPEEALDRAQTAYQIGYGKSDDVAIARALILKAMIGHYRIESVEGGPHEVDASFAVQILDDAKSAVEYANKTQNPRLQARAYAWLGRILMKRPFFGLYEASRQLAKAESLLAASPKDQDYVRAEVTALREELHRSQQKEAVVLEITLGEAMTQSLKQLEEEVGRRIVQYLDQCGLSQHDMRKLLKAGAGKISRLYGQSKPGC